MAGEGSVWGANPGQVSELTQMRREIADAALRDGATPLAYMLTSCAILASLPLVGIKWPRSQRHTFILAWQ
jgi:hypothetical protein